MTLSFRTPAWQARWQKLAAGFARPGAVPVAVAISLLLPLFFALYTREIWEDFFITYRYSENLARGHGLVYTPGEHIYGFTSPLNTLLPALFALLTGAGSYTVPLWLYRLVSLAGLGLALAAVARLFTREHAAPSPGWCAGLLFPVLAVLEIKITAFTMNGQETGLVLAFLGPAFVLAWRGWAERPWLGGALCAGLMYSRPDAFAYIGAIAVAALAFAPADRRTLLRAFLKSAALGALLYLPWLLFTWTYYGSPVPHTVIAKYGVEVSPDSAWGLTASLAAGLRKAPDILTWTFAPIYDWFDNAPGGWPRWTHDVELLLTLTAVLYWLLPTRDRLGRMASLASFLVFGYLLYAGSVAQFAPWYYPPLAFLSLITLTCVILTASGTIRLAWAARCAAALAGAGLLAFLALIFTDSLRPLRFQQAVIEWGNRALIGQWLKTHVPKGEGVYLEPLGYIGYFSQCKMLDWPGLVSPEVVAARRQISRKAGYTWLEVAEVLKPAWIVARGTEAQAMQASAILAPDYHLMKVFDVSEQVRAEGVRPGMRMVYSEVAYGVFRRNP
ncbi:MAG TPA: hypothetical protein VMD31_09645 [Opitutaceae bacterium]|nr:hypothetical protein [Opitutaceae bacterium]